LLVAAAIASVISGVCGVLLVSRINMALTVENHTAALAWTFAGLIVAVMLSRTLSAVLFERLGQHALAELRRYISSRVLGTDFRRLEMLGGAKVQSALSEHSTNVAQFFVSMPAILTNAVIVIGCMIYMALLSWQIFMAAVVMIGLGSLGYHFAHLRAIKHLGNASKEQDRLFGHFRALVDGAKELRLHAQKRRMFKGEVLGASIDQVRRSRSLGMSIFVASASWGNFLIYAFIGLVLFVLVGDIPDRNQVMTGFALVFLYMVVPLEVLLLNIPRANLARVAADRINEITKHIPAVEVAETERSSTPPTKLESLHLKGVTHRYYHEQSDEVFELGPIDLTFHPGSVTFLVGGNGSGKTTLAKLLVGLYVPEAGDLWLNGDRIDERNRDGYRQLFSAIFSDFHLFERLLELERTDLDDEGNRLLARLHLQHKAKVIDGAFTTQALSQGQRKRLALVAACLEDRSFLVFDEWAADQDPVFKEVFYRELLPELKAQGKAVLVISHDDRYFHLGDRLLKLEDGQLSKIGHADNEVALSPVYTSVAVPAASA
jgi:putative ATP-binding cassette transporter